MQQFNSTFVDRHLLPLLQTMLMDVALDAAKPIQEKPYYIQLVQYGVFTIEEKHMLKRDYFLKNPNQTSIPFQGNDEEIGEFINCFEAFVRNVASQPYDRWKLLVPVQDPKNPKEFVWPINVQQRLYRMAYEIASTFEKKRIASMLQKEEQKNAPDFAQIAEKKDLNQKGLLMLVKYPDGSWKYITKEQAQKLASVVRYIGMPSTLAREMINGENSSVPPLTISFGRDINAIPDQSSSHEEIVADFQKRRAMAMRQTLELLGLKPQGEVDIKNNTATVIVQSGEELIVVTARVDTPLDQDLNYNFSFTDQFGIAHTYSATEGQLKGLFQNQQSIQKPLEAPYANSEPSIQDRESQITSPPKVDAARLFQRPPKKNPTQKNESDSDEDAESPSVFTGGEISYEKEDAIEKQPDNIRKPKFLLVQKIPYQQIAERNFNFEKTGSTIQENKMRLYSKKQKFTPTSAPSPHSKLRPQISETHQPQPGIDARHQPLEMQLDPQSAREKSSKGNGKKILLAAAAGVGGLTTLAGGATMLLEIIT